MALPVSRLVRVLINLSPIAAARRSFGILMIAGDSPVINGLERFRSYDSIDGVVQDFGVDAPEYKAAALYFGQTPKPRTVMIGRWISAATSAMNIGGIFTTAQKLISNFTAISAGSFSITIDNVAKNLTNLDFTGVTNLNGVADVINASLTGATIAWDGSKFTVTSGTQGAGTKASGTVTFTTNPADGDTLDLNGTTLRFKTVPTLVHDVLIGASSTATAANLQLFLNTLVDTNINTATYATSANVTTITYKLVGLGGNAYSLANTGAHITLSGATLSGGTEASSVSYATVEGVGTDISSLLKLSFATNIAIVPGYDTEEPVAAVAILANKSAAWYGLMFASTTPVDDSQSLLVSDFVEAQDITRIYGVTVNDPNVLSALVTTDMASLQKAAGYKQSLCQYSQTAFAIASLFGRMFSVDFNANSSTITLMYKQEPGVTGEDLTTTEANVLKDKRCNVFTDYVNDTVIIQYGVMSGPAYIDEIHGLDWFQDAVQNACYNVLYQSTTKVPQTDAGQNQLVNAVGGVCDEAVNNGLVAPGTWNADGFGTLVNGQYLKTGYYIFANPIALQSQSDRETRVAPPIQVAIKLAGAIQELDVIVNVNR